MNTDTLLSFVVQQLAWQSPVLLVYVVGIVLCAVRVRQAPVGAVLAIVGLGLLLVTAVGFTLVQGLAIQGMNAGSASWRQVWTAVGLVGSLTRAVGIGLLVAAVFAGRARAVGGGFEVPVAARGPGR